MNMTPPLPHDFESLHEELTERTSSGRKVKVLTESITLENRDDFFGHWLPFCTQLLHELGFDCLENDQDGVEQRMVWKHPQIGSASLRLEWSIPLKRGGVVFSCSSHKAMSPTDTGRTEFGNMILKVIRDEWSQR